MENEHCPLLREVLRLEVQERSSCYKNLEDCPPWGPQGAVHPALYHYLPKPSLLTTAAPRHPMFQPFLSEEIIGGHEAKPHSRPYMAFVQFLDKGKKKRCGGVLVHKYFVLTAAHCWGR